MKALSLENPSVTRDSLLKLAEKILGECLGIRIAAMMLALRGWKSS